MSRAARTLLALLVLALPAAAGGEEAAVAEAARPRIEDALPRGPSVADRLAEIRRRVEDALVYPPLARWRDATGETRVRFTIDAAGRARDVAVEHSSGQPLLDAAAVKAVGDAGVLPRVHGLLEIPIRFELQPRR